MYIISTACYNKKYFVQKVYAYIFHPYKIFCPVSLLRFSVGYLCFPILAISAHPVLSGYFTPAHIISQNGLLLLTRKTHWHLKKPIYPIDEVNLNKLKLRRISLVLMQQNKDLHVHFPRTSYVFCHNFLEKHTQSLRTDLIERALCSLFKQLIRQCDTIKITTVSYACEI